MKAVLTLATLFAFASLEPLEGQLELVEVSLGTKPAEDDILAPDSNARYKVIRRNNLSRKIKRVDYTDEEKNQIKVYLHDRGIALLSAILARNENKRLVISVDGEVMCDPVVRKGHNADALVVTVPNAAELRNNQIFRALTDMVTPVADEKGKQEKGKQEKGKQEEGKQEEGKQEEGKEEGQFSDASV